MLTDSNGFTPEKTSAGPFLCKVTYNPCRAVLSAIGSLTFSSLTSIFPVPSVSNRSKASRISCFCSSVNSGLGLDFFLWDAAPSEGFLKLEALAQQNKSKRASDRPGKSGKGLQNDGPLSSPRGCCRLAGAAPQPCCREGGAGPSPNPAPAAGPDRTHHPDGRCLGAAPVLSGRCSTLPFPIG